MALFQTHLVVARLVAAHPFLRDKIELRPMTTSGDQYVAGASSATNVKGLFTKELEVALTEGVIDIAVHSLKDVAAHLPNGLQISCVLRREDVRDALLTPDGVSLGQLKKGARIGTSSPRRSVQLLTHCPDLVVLPLRGNVGTRLSKLEENFYDGLILSRAGLDRLSFEKPPPHVCLDPTIFVPSPGQGAIALETCKDREDLIPILAPLHDVETGDSVLFERAFQAAVDGSCQTPLGAWAESISNTQVRLHGFIGDLVSNVSVLDSIVMDRSAPKSVAENFGRHLRSLVETQTISLTLGASQAKHETDS